MRNGGQPATLRARIERVIERVTRIGFSGRAVLSDVAVLDGRTLTGVAVIHGVRARDCTELLVVATRAEGGRRVALAGTPVERNGRLTASVAVPLESPDGLQLRKGEWRVTLAYRTRRGAQRPIPTTAGTLPAGRRSPTVANPRSPGTGRRYRPSIDAAGNLVVKVMRFPTHAEVERVQVRGTELALAGRIIGSAKLARRAARAEVWVVVIRAGGGQRRRFPARVAGGAFTATIPLQRLRFTDDADWVVRLRIGSAKPLVVRRVLTDLREPAAVYQYPVARLRGRRRMTATYGANTALLLQGRRLPPPQEAPA